MANKEHFSNRDWEFLCQLPYRVGAWMSHQDIGGGHKAATAEEDALLHVVQRIQEKYANISFIRDLSTDLCCHAQQTKLNSDKTWPIVLADIPRAITLIESHTDVIESNCYKLVLIDVAEAVAKAAPDRVFGVHNLFGGPEKGWLGLYPLLAKIMRLGRGPRVSVQEKMAINTLIQTMDAQNLIQNWEIYPTSRTADTESSTLHH